MKTTIKKLRRLGIVSLVAFNLLLGATPVVAGELEQRGRPVCAGIAAGDGIDHLARTAILQLADALDAADCADARPVLIEAGRQLGAYLDAPCLDAAMALLDCLGALQIGRITPLGGELARNGGDHVARGERRRRPF